MASINTRQSSRFSTETDSTIKDIWQYSQQAGSCDPRAMDQALDIQRQVRRQARPPDRGSLGHFLDEDSPLVRDEEVSRAMKRRSAVHVNVQKSIQMLDEAVKTPGSLLRSSHRTPSSTLRHASYTSQQIPSGSKFDVSSVLGLSTPGRSMIATPGSTRASFGDTGLDFSLGMTTLGTSMAAEKTGGLGAMDEDVTTTNVALLLEEDPGLAASTGLYSDFMSSLKGHTAQQQVFDLLQDYEQLCDAQVTLLKKLVKRATPGQSKFTRVVETLEGLRQEKCTWRLITSLYRDRLETDVKIDEEPMMIDQMGKRTSEKQIVQNLYEREAMIRQAQLVIDWLENNAFEELENYYDKVEFFTDATGSWENTLHTLHQKKGSVPLSSDRPMVDALDPDAPIRQQRPLADLDQEDEARLLKYVFANIRAGQLDEAQRLCAKCGQAWRAATLEGWKLFHDPNCDSMTAAVERHGVEGNPYRDIWKAACWRMAEDERFSMTERAMYAALSGNLKHLLPACSSWSDHVWAYFRVMVDTRVEQEIRINSTLDRAVEELPATYWDKMMTMDTIFKNIQASPNEKIRTQAKGRFHIIQKYIILGDIDALIEELYEWTKDEVNRPPCHLVRFMAHLLLFYRTVGISTKEELCVSILEYYVRDLVEDKQTDLVAVYVATLPQELQIECYARFLEGIQDTEMRKHCLSLAQEAGLDIPNITKLVVENIRSRDSTDFSMNLDVALEATVSEEDRQKIEAIEWLVFDPRQRAEAIRQANAVMRGFLATRKHTAAREVSNKIPAGSIDIIIKSWQEQTGTTELCAEDDNAIREYLCIQAYLDAQDFFNDWFEHYHNSKPVKPDATVGATFSERVAYEHKQKQFQADLDRWQHSLMLQSKNTVERIHNVLLFVDGGWMVDQRKDGPKDGTRTHQMLLLRQICLPRVCFLLHIVLHTTGQYKECLQLADIIASEQHRLYTWFQRDELQKFLQKMRESALALLDSNLDPLGYDFS